MADFGEGRKLVGNKDHRCEWCGQKIPKGDLHYQFKGLWEGEWQNWRMHLECYGAYSSDANEMCDGFTPFEGERPVSEVSNG
jgi:hypothetical protein